MSDQVCVYIGEALTRYGFGHDHPFGPDRMDAFWNEAKRQGLDKQVRVCTPAVAEQAAIERFHTHDYVERVKHQSQSGTGFLDYGDTPAFPGVYEAAAIVVGSTLDALEQLVSSRCQRAFVPIAGLHHARRDVAAGFCVFNDCGVAIETLRQKHGIERVGYVDIDAHHGDGVFYSFEDDPALFFVDFHEDGRFLYPGTGSASETGRGAAVGTKRNIPMPPYADDNVFMRAWEEAETWFSQREPEIILLQCGADSLAGDPITQLNYSIVAHRHAATRLCHLADQFCQGRILALGGGGYNRQNLAQAWTAVVQAFVEATD
jgi:acetoin utilization protein AcuC